MSANSSPGQTPTLATIPRSSRVPKSSPLASGTASPSGLPESPETATFANTTSRKVSDTGRPPPSLGESSSDSNPNKRLVPNRKARDLLRQHYKMAPSPPTPVPGRPDDPMDIDSKVFDAKAYYEQLITTTSLSGLLKRENELAAEIRRLDGEKQSLVYNHHHELIAASDTIRAVKSRADSLDADLEKLRMAFSEISRLAAEVTKSEDSQNRGN